MNSKGCVVLLLVLLVVAATSVSAQTFRGTILGTVSDTSGAVVSGATVKVRNTATGLERTTQTSAEGNYSIAELPIGTYTVTITQSGFQTAVTSNVLVDVATERRVDVALKLGQVSDTVEVSGEAIATGRHHQRRTGRHADRADHRQHSCQRTRLHQAHLPEPGRIGIARPDHRLAGFFRHVFDERLARPFQQLPARRHRHERRLPQRSRRSTKPVCSAIRRPSCRSTPSAELRVLSNYEAEYGRNSGAVVNIVTKSGTNQWHGSALEYYRSGAMGARNYFNIDSQPKNPFTNNQFGGSLGGPIVKDKAFFFVNYEGQRESGAQAGLSCVPDAGVIAAAQAQAAANGTPLSQPMLNLLARNPWPSPNISGSLGEPRRHLQCAQCERCRRQSCDLNPLLQQRRQPDREGRLQSQHR